MLRPAAVLLLAALLVQGGSATSADAPVAPLATTRAGPVRGRQQDGILVFQGVPYGATTAGDNRFRAPKPPAPWKQTRDATRYGPRCYQLPAPPDADSAWRSWTDTSAMSEDCLTLSVWTPGLRDGRKRPVMVWLHGGGYSVGSGNSSINDGTRLARRGDVVVVSVNHRLNLFGYLYLEGLGGADFADAANAGQLDIIAALRWVKDNIEEFGGDAGNVTVFGESGGGGKVGTLMAMPEARGLFHRAAMQSGFAVTVGARDSSAAFAEKFVQILGLTRSRIGELRRLPPQKLLEALDAVTGGSPTAILPVVDGRHLLRDPFTPDAPVESASVPLLLGYNATETTVLFPPPGVFTLDWPGLETQLKQQMPEARVSEIVAGLRALRPEATPSDLYFFITTERGMGANARTVAERKARQRGAPVFLYRLAWATAVLGGKLRTPHSLDIPMVFDNVAASTSLVGDATADPQRVADAMSAAWIAFARSGSPNGPGLASWPAFDPQRRSVMSFDVVSRAIDDPLRREHEVLGLAPAGPQAREPRLSCSGLAGRSFYNVTITSAVDVGATAALPAYCKVSGNESGTDHDLEVRLPARWLGRYVQRGGGGFDGRIPAAGDASDALRLGAAEGANNGGHRDPSGAALLNDPRATERYAHSAILTATRFGKAVTQAYYGDAPAYAYYDGCSNGGRGALNAAAKYGSEFDGIVAKAPTLNMPGIVLAMARFGALSLPTTAQFAAVHAAVVDRCDALDGLKDGIVSHWQACRIDPARDLPASIGLSPPQVEALRVLWTGLRRADGSVLYEGLGYGDLTAGAGIYERFGHGHLAYVVHSDAKWTPPGGVLDVERELPAIRAVLEDRYQFSASVSGLAQYLREGRKLLVWHGANDPILSHRDTARTWGDIAAAAGPQVMQDGARLYLAPGVEHCGGGEGADSVDALQAMMSWVEAKQAPGTLLASKRDPATGRVRFTRPLCEYPKWPRYQGKGDVNDAGSFACVADP